MQDIKDTYYYGIRKIVAIYILALITSYLFVCITGELNGDFIGEYITIPQIVLFLLFIISLLPFIYVWNRYKYYKRKLKLCSAINVVNVLGGYALIFLVFNIIIRALGVGVMTGNATQNWVGTLGNNIFIFYLFAGAFLLESRKRINVILISALFLVACVLKASLQEVFYLLLFILLRYYATLKRVLIKYWVLIPVLFVIALNGISFLYELRAELRTKDDISLKEVEPTEILCETLAGRLSCYSDVAFIVENAPTFYIYAQTIPVFFYQAQWLDRFGVHLGNWADNLPERFLYEQNKNSKEDAGTSFMLGMPGMLIVSFMRSPWVFLINLISMLLLIELYFALLLKLSCPGVLEVGLTVLLYPILSGVSLELFFAVIQCAIFWICIRKLNFNAHLCK